MAKKSKRPPARKQAPSRQRPRPAAPQRADLQAPGTAELPQSDLEQDDYATGSLPVPESDGAMPLPPADEDGEGDYEPEEAPAPQRVPVAAATGAGERRRVGRIDPNARAAAAVQQRPGQKARGGRPASIAAMFDPLPPEDAAIPFDRVPYVPGDLRRVLIIGGLMVVLVVVADFVVNAIVK